jgi:hypothetical protein
LSENAARTALNLALLATAIAPSIMEGTLGTRIVSAVGGALTLFAIAWDLATTPARIQPAS